MDNNLSSLEPQTPKPVGFPPPPPPLPPTPPAPRPPAPPPPPPPEINLRTMKNDLESLEKGSAPLPTRSFTPPPPPPQSLPRTSAPPPPPPLTPLTSSGQVKPSVGPAPTVITPLNLELPKEAALEEEGVGQPKKLMWLGVLIVAIGVGLLGYFVLFPMLFSKTPAAPPPPPVSETTSPPPAAPEPARVHLSLLRLVDTTNEVSVTALDLNSLKSALQEEAKRSFPTATFSEVVLNDATGPLALNQVLPLFLSSLPSFLLDSTFESDWTLALYYDTDGVWPVWVLKIKSSVNVAEVQGQFNPLLESSPDLENLYLESPGAPKSDTFKDGLANEVPTRYLSFSKKGAGLNTAWVNDKFIISASYNGLKKALSNL